MEQKHIYQALNAMVLKNFPEWEIHNYVTGEKLGIVEIYSSLVHAQWKFILLDAETGEFKDFHSEIKERSEVNESHYSLLKAFLFEKEEKILITRPQKPLMYFKFSTKGLKVSGIQNFNSTAYSTNVGDWHRHAERSSVWGSVIHADFGNLFGVQINDNFFAIIEKYSWKIIATIEDISKIPFVKWFYLLDHPDKNLRIIVLLIQHETTAYLRKRIGVWIGSKEFNSAHDLVSTTIFGGDVKDIKSIFENDKCRVIVDIPGKPIEMSFKVSEKN